MKLFGVYGSDSYTDPAVIEGVFSSEPAACEWAQKRSRQGRDGQAQVVCWVADRPGLRDLVAEYRGGERTWHHVERDRLRAADAARGIQR